jgi:hypothetical protein
MTFKTHKGRRFICEGCSYNLFWEFARQSDCWD